LSRVIPAGAGIFLSMLKSNKKEDACPPVGERQGILTYF